MVEYVNQHGTIRQFGDMALEGSNNGNILISQSVKSITKDNEVSEEMRWSSMSQRSNEDPQDTVDNLNNSGMDVIDKYGRVSRVKLAQ